MLTRQERGEIRQDLAKMLSSCDGRNEIYRCECDHIKEARNFHEDRMQGLDTQRP
jgi:hypothetical protein